jgi:hypothetical protein
MDGEYDMSNITFNQGGYNKQSSIGISDGMLFFNPQNRTISIDGNNRTYFNTMMVNDNHQADNVASYTQSSDYIYSHKVPIGNTQLYYNTTDADNIIGVKNVSGGYITHVLQQLNNGITYESSFDSVSQIVTKIDTFGNTYQAVRNKYTFNFPTNLPKDKKINMLIVFIYNTVDETNIYVDINFFSCNNSLILNVKDQTDVSYTLEYPVSNNGVMDVFKAFWV